MPVAVSDDEHGPRRRRRPRSSSTLELHVDPVLEPRPRRRRRQPTTTAPPPPPPPPPEPPSPPSSELVRTGTVAAGDATDGGLHVRATMESTTQAGLYLLTVDVELGEGELMNVFLHGAAHDPLGQLQRPLLVGAAGRTSSGWHGPSGSRRPVPRTWSCTSTTRGVTSSSSVPSRSRSTLRQPGAALDGDDGPDPAARRLLAVSPGQPVPGRSCDASATSELGTASAMERVHAVARRSTSAMARRRAALDAAAGLPRRTCRTERSRRPRLRPGHAYGAVRRRRRCTSTPLLDGVPRRCSSGVRCRANARVARS